MTGDPEIGQYSDSPRTADTHRLLAILAAHRSGLRDLARTYYARDIHVFGSVARGDAGPHSDIDLLASFTGPDYEQLMSMLGLAEQLTELFGVAVDVVARERPSTSFPARPSHSRCDCHTILAPVPGGVAATRPAGR